MQWLNRTGCPISLQGIAQPLPLCSIPSVSGRPVVSPPRNVVLIISLIVTHRYEFRKIDKISWVKHLTIRTVTTMLYVTIALHIKLVRILLEMPAKG